MKQSEELLERIAELKADLETAQEQLTAVKKQEALEGSLEDRKAYAAELYQQILDDNIDNWDYDDDVVDDIVRKQLPQRLLNAIANDNGKANWGLLPIIKSPRMTDDTIQIIIDTLTACIKQSNETGVLDAYMNEIYDPEKKCFVPDPDYIDDEAYEDDEE